MAMLWTVPRIERLFWLARYVADVIVLDGRPVIRIRSVTPRGKFLVGYFGSVDAIHDQGARSSWRTC
jgi:hypothetical protein